MNTNGASSSKQPGQTDQDAYTDLEAPKQFLYRLLAHVFDKGLRTAQDFVTFFPPQRLMQATRGNEAQGLVLYAVTNMAFEAGMAQDHTVAAAILEAVLRADPEKTAALLQAFPPLAQVRFLSPTELWAFLETISLTGAAAQDLVHLALDKGLELKLLDYDQVLAGNASALIQEYLREDSLARVGRLALKCRASKQTAADDDIYVLLTLARDVPLDVLWDAVIRSCIAIPCGFAPVPVQPGEATDPAQAPAPRSVVPGMVVGNPNEAPSAPLDEGVPADPKV